MPERQQEKLLANLDKVKVPFNLPKKKKLPLVGGESWSLYYPFFYQLHVCASLYFAPKYEYMSKDLCRMATARLIWKSSDNFSIKSESDSSEVIFFCSYPLLAKVIEWKHTIEEMDSVL